MQSLYAFDVKANFLSSTVWCTCAVQTEFTLPRVKAKKTMGWKRVLFDRLQSDNVPIKCGNSQHIIDKEYNTSYLHTVAPDGVM